MRKTVSIYIQCVSFFISKTFLSDVSFEKYRFYVNVVAFKTYVIRFALYFRSPIDADEITIPIPDTEPSEPKKNVKQAKRGRPAKAKNEDTRPWTDREIEILIEFWSQHENLYNTKHKSYFNRDLRQKSLTVIETSLKNHEIQASIKQISKKLTDLKNYYGGQRRMIENSKSSGAGADDVYLSPWKFYESLEFLNDAFTPRKTKSNGFDEPDDDSPYAEAKPPSSKSSKKMALAQQNELHKVMSTAASALESVISSRKDQPISKDKSEDADDAFVKLLVSQLKTIPDCDLKDDLKITLQQMTLRCKRQVASSYQQNQTGAIPFAPPASPLSNLSSPRNDFSVGY